jgi:MoaA/NifB/PqqE/SkfB family radical SAM enzyme
MIKNFLPILKGRIPGQIIIQMTNNCNAKCPQCGMNINEKIKRNTLNKSKVKEIIDYASLNKFQSISFTGGEPLLYLDDLLEYIEYAYKKEIPLIRTGTNGFIFKNFSKDNFTSEIEKVVIKIKKSHLRNFWISIDSSDIKTHEEIRGLSGVIKGIEKSLPIFHKNNIYPAANLGINRYMSKSLLNSNGKVTEKVMENSFREFLNHVINLGFTMTNMCYPMSINKKSSNLDSIYGASSTKDIVNFTKEEKVIIFNAALKVIPEYRNKIQIFTPRVSLYSLINDLKYENKIFSYPCKGGIDFFFVDSENGKVYPCGFRGNEEIDIKRLNKIKNKPICRKCDWECFRDPSELLGSFSNFFISPTKTFNKTIFKKEYLKLLIEDIKYYKKCNYFNGREKPFLLRINK